MEPPQCGPSKRARAPSSAIQVASCLVDGCNSDLSKCKEYHRRHKVCEAHSKAPRITIGGQEQRFCQQCSRFHALVEFDGDKRSCRKRLDGHNKRRRKPQPDTLSLTHGRFMTNHPGAKFIPFGSPQLFPSSALERCSWPGAVKVESDHMPYHCHQVINFGDRNILSPGSLSSGCKGQTPFQILQGADAVLPQPSARKSARDPNSLSANGGSCHKLSANESTSVITSDRALSLLSSPSTNTSETGLSHMMPPGQSSLAQSSIASLHNNRMQTNGDVAPALMSEDDKHGSRYIYQMEIQGSSANEHHQTSSFTW